MPRVRSPGRLNFNGGDKYLRVHNMKLELCQPFGAYNFDVALRILTNLHNPASKE
jgi:hypothetical protein